jgi:hypothetical protein
MRGQGGQRRSNLTRMTAACPAECKDNKKGKDKVKEYAFEGTE